MTGSIATADRFTSQPDIPVTGTYNGDYSHALDVALAAVATPQPGSPADTRTGINTNFDLVTNAACNYGDNPVTLRFCEFAVLNKANTHETRVHHVETPERVLSGESWTGPLWITEVTYAKNWVNRLKGWTSPLRSG